jgi:hypothetical protein
MDIAVLPERSGRRAIACSLCLADMLPGVHQFLDQMRALTFGKRGIAQAPEAPPARRNSDRQA